MSSNNRKNKTYKEIHFNLHLLFTNNQSFKNIKNSRLSPFNFFQI